MHSHDYVERLTRQTPTPQQKSLTGRPVFNITVQGTYNPACGFPRTGLSSDYCVSDAVGRRLWMVLWQG